MIIFYKKLVIFCYLFLNFFLILGQTYYPFLDSNAIWSEIYYEEVYHNNSEYYQYGIIGDTNINSIKYNKLYLLADTLLDNTLSNIFWGAIREDSVKRVYYLGRNTHEEEITEEIILYDFSKQVGDTIFSGYEYEVPNIIVEIDSILIGDQYRKTFHFDSPIFWIEGIGSTRGLLSPVTDQPTCSCHWELVCFKQGNEVLYLNPNFNQCFPLLSNINKNNIRLFSKVYPNPVTDISFLDFGDSNFRIIEIYDLMGKRIKSFNIEGLKNTHIKKNNFTPGLYIYKLSGEKGLFMNGKFIVN